VTAPYTTDEGDSFEVPEGWVPDHHSAACRSCHALIVWCRTPGGKRAPVDPDGKSHFASCPDAEKWRRPKGVHDRRGRG